MRLLLFFTLLFCLPQISTAQPALIRSGEHKGFTRLVVISKEKPDWSIVQQGNEVTLTFENYREGFDASNVFDFIPRSRIKSIETAADHLILTLNCTCNVAAFLERGVYVVIDVGTLGQALVGPLIKSSPSISRTASKVPETEVGPVPELPSLLSKRDRQLGSEIPLMLRREKLTPRAHKLLSDVQERLVTELSLAASQGTLDPKEPVRSDLPKVALREDNPTASEQPDNQNLDTNTFANMRISSSRDSPEQGRTRQKHVNLDGTICPSAREFEISSWGDTRSFDIQIGERRRGLYDAVDNLDSEAAIELAKNFLYFGFGAEAREVLELEPDLATQHRPLLEISDFLEERNSDQGFLLASFVNCSSDVSLWAILASSPDFAAEDLDTDAALRALNKAPIHLRSILAPALSQKLLSIGNAEDARAALRSLQRLPGALPPAAEYAQANVALQQGEIEGGTEHLLKVVDQNTPQSPEALVAFVNTQLEAGLPIKHDIAELVEAYAKELNDTELGPGLRRAHVIALVKTGAFEQAFEASALLGGDEDTESANALRRDLLRELISAANDITFLEHIFVQRDSEIMRLTPDDLVLLTRRFLDLGFALRAENALGHVPEYAVKDVHRLLAAQISLALNKPFKAQADILGLSSPAAYLLRARAKQMAGEMDEAYQIYVRLDRSQDAADTAWLADDWRILTPQDTPVFGPASRLSVAPTTAAAEATGMLSRSAALLEESATARQTLQDLLDINALPEISEN